MTDYGQVIWITGLSGAGKTTLAKKLTSKLRRQSKSIVMLDGDELRNIFGAEETNQQNYSRESRVDLAMKYSKLCQAISKQGVNVIIATISLFKEVHAWNRINIPGYFEIYLKVPVEELRRRDPKKIYQRYDSGKLKNVAGLDVSINEPLSADLVLEFQEDFPMAKKVCDLTKTLNRRMSK